MKIGIVLPHHEIGSDPDDMKAFATGAEALGADHILIYDHVLGADREREGGFEGPYDKDTQFHEPLTTLSFIAAVTNTIELVTTVLILPQRQTALVAKQAAELAILSKNRFRLGVGTGWNAVEYEALNENFHDRGKRQAEQVALLRALWSEDSLTFEGEFHQVTKASINPRPTQPIPVWFGGGAPALLDRCARLGDGWMPLSSPNEQSKSAIDHMRQVREQAGLPWDGFGIQAQAQAGGGSPDRWQKHYSKWHELGATHIAVATHNAGATSVGEHLELFKNYLKAVRS
ncbi:MAG: LLM class F420-dependent oxidoreductase [Pseudomonadota bacterium]